MTAPAVSGLEGNHLDVYGDEEERRVEKYSMHVSSRYLELTRKKLDLTRLPKELELSEEKRWAFGVPKSVLEPLLDYWLAEYDWRTQESLFNNTLPQYRITISIPAAQPPFSNAPTHSVKSDFKQRPQTPLGLPTAPTSPTPEGSTNSPSATEEKHSLKLHFTHRPSSHLSAVPLLYIHTYPSSFIEVHKIIDSLVEPDPVSTFSNATSAESGATSPQAFSVVCPSLPGFGFSEAGGEGFGIWQTAEMLGKLMSRLGYASSGYLITGSGRGFDVARAMAIRFPENVLGIHTANPVFRPPSWRKSFGVWTKWRIARMVGARVPGLSFGFLPSEVAGSHDGGQDRDGITTGAEQMLRPQTLSFSLCDSPIGLLASTLDTLLPRHSSAVSPPSRSRSPFLDPEELEMQTHPHDQNAMHTIHEEESERTESRPLSNVSAPQTPHSHAEEGERGYTWTPTELLNWTMLQWLPGPEAGLRWVHQALRDTAPDSLLATTYVPVPLGISTFRGREEVPSPVMWGEAVGRIEWVRRHGRSAKFPAWECGDEVVGDLMDWVHDLLARGLIPARTVHEEV